MLSDKAKTVREPAPKSGLAQTTEDGIFHISRCQSCGRLLTKLELVAKLNAAHAGEPWTGACKCGASRFRPSYPHGLEWVAPRVLKMAWAVWRGQVQPGESR